MKWTTYFFDELDSTNTHAVHYPVGSVIISGKQTAGRGRNNRFWISQRGNLFLSAVLPVFGDNTPLLAFVAGVSLAEALSDLPVFLKWPNDVLLNGAKIAGILLERNDNKIVAGFGVNIINAPQEENIIYPTAHLPAGYTPQSVAEGLLDKLSENLILFKKSGFLPIRRKWLKFAAGIGTKIKVSLPHEICCGIFDSLTPQGAISLKTSTGIRLITAGDVFLSLKEKND